MPFLSCTCGQKIRYPPEGIFRRIPGSICFLLTKNHNLDRSTTPTCLVPIDEVDAAEFTQIHFTIHGNDGHIAANDGRSQVSIGIVAAEVVLTVLLCKDQGLGAGMEVLALITAGRHPVFKGVHCRVSSPVMDMSKAHSWVITEQVVW